LHVKHNPKCIMPLVQIQEYHAIGELLQSKTILEKEVSKEEGESEMDMCKALEDLYQDGVTEGGDKKLKEQVAKKVQKGLSVSEIADMLEESEEVIEEIIASL